MKEPVEQGIVCKQCKAKVGQPCEMTGYARMGFHQSRLRYATKYRRELAKQRKGRQS